MAGAASPPRVRVAFFGHFAGGNFGNDATLEAILYHLRRFHPDADVTCVGTQPDAVAAAYGIDAIPMWDGFGRSLQARSRPAKLARLVYIGLPLDLYGWLRGLALFARTDVFIVPGTGLLTDAYGLFSWGPYNCWKWTLMARLWRRKVFYVSVGAGPIYGRIARMLLRSALSLANQRSYRDDSSKEYLSELHLGSIDDRVVPDLVFSLPVPRGQQVEATPPRRPVVGLGVMEYARSYNVARPDSAYQTSYLDALVTFAVQLVADGYDVRLLVGDTGDEPTKEEFKRLVESRLSTEQRGHILDDRLVSVATLVEQIRASDVVVATRFHNVLLSLLLEKPTIAVSFHPKCRSLMESIGLSRYCMDFNTLRSDALLEAFRDLDLDTEEVGRLTRTRIAEFQVLLNEQYEMIFLEMWPGGQPSPPGAEA